MSLPFPFLLSFFLSLYTDCRSIEHARLRITLPLFYHHLHFDLLYHLLHPCLSFTFPCLSRSRSSAPLLPLLLLSPFCFTFLCLAFLGTGFFSHYFTLVLLNLYFLICIVLTRAIVHVAYPFLFLEDRTSVDDISHVELTLRERFSRS